MSSRSVRILATALVAVLAAAAGIGAALLYSDTIYPGVLVAGVDLGGLTPVEAERRLILRAAEMAEERITLGWPGGAREATLAELGWRLEVPASVLQAYSLGRDGSIFSRLREILSARREPVELHVYVFEKDRGVSYLEHLGRRYIDRQPANAKLVLSDGDVRGVAERSGAKLDIEKSREHIAEAVDAGSTLADLAVTSIPPRVTAADFKGIDGAIAAYSTPYKPWERDRTHNLKVACNSINGTLLKPDEVFSYNKEVGPRLKKYGFRDAPIFVHGEIEPGTGGGVCQVSTTVYNAALLADMKILRRSHHSRPVVYAPVGQDATVAPGVDLRFENTTGSPVYILASVGRRTVDVTFLGKTQDGREVRVIPAGHTTIRAEVVEKAEDGLEQGKRIVRRSGRPGHRVSIYRVVKVGGVIVKRELVSNDYYRPESQIVAIPSQASHASPPPASPPP